MATGQDDPLWFTFWPWLGRQIGRGDAIGQLASIPDLMSLPGNSPAGSCLTKARMEHAAWYNANFPGSPAGTAEAARIEAEFRTRGNVAQSRPDPFEGDTRRLAADLAKTLDLVAELLYSCIKTVSDRDNAQERLGRKWSTMATQISELKRASVLIRSESRI